jgi:hypothetical protein
MEINVIFLDIDGVLNPDKTPNPKVFARECVVQLNRILDADPQARIVFSTSWRTGFPLFALGWCWREHDLPMKRILSRTPDIRNDRRGDEIAKWLADAPALYPEFPVRRYAALDDEVEPILEKIPAHSVFACDPWHGLTLEVADRVIRHFNAPDPVAKPGKSRKTA